MVNKMVYQLALGKATGIDKLTVEHIKNCHPIIIVVLTKLFNLMQRCDYVSDAFGVGLTVPIPKRDAPKNSGSTKDYRGITVSSVIY